MASNPVPGIIIAASVLVAAGVAIYETNPQLRAWLEESRRKIALALQNLGQDPSNASRRGDESEETREQRRWFEEGLEAEMRRQGWNGEVFQRPDMEGVNMELRRRRAHPSSTAPSASRSFDNLISEDGSLRREHRATASASAGARAFDRGASMANPFGDEYEVSEKSQMLFDQDLIGADQDNVLEHEKETIIGRSRESTATLRGDEKQEPLVDVHEASGQSQPNRPKAFLGNMLQSLVPGAFAPQEEDDFELQMRKAIEASLHDTHGDSSLDADEDANLKAAIAASLEDAKAHEQSSSNGKGPETKEIPPPPLPGLGQPNPWSDSSASVTSFHSAHSSSASSLLIPTSATFNSLGYAAASRSSETSQPTQPLGAAAETEDLYTLSRTPTPIPSPSFVTSPSVSRPPSALSSSFSALTPSPTTSEASEIAPPATPPQYPIVLAISPLDERGEAEAMTRPEEDEGMSVVSGWSEVDAGAEVSTPGDWTDVESEAEGMSEDGGHAQGERGPMLGTHARL
ncbi:MAG: hypothetical protein M1822_001614 [Bathelium mastoideum]|nr:MAG: hypothetical protein M1822_001614 [Bathelium mastoideum]